MGRQHQGMDRLGVRQVPEGSGEQGKMEETGCEIICGAPTTLAVKGQMLMMMMMMMMMRQRLQYFGPDSYYLHLQTFLLTSNLLAEKKKVKL